MRICIVGAGAIGSFLAAKLGASGADVSMIARGAALAAIRANGLRMEEASGETVVQMPASEAPGDFGPQDIVVVATKAHGLASVAASAGPLLGAETQVVFAQNGVPWWYAHGFTAPGLAPGPLTRIDPDGAIWNGFGPERAVGCTIFSPNSVPAPGVVRNASVRPSTYTLGQPDGKTSPGLKAFAAALEAAGVNAPIAADIRREVWAKLLFNVATASTAVLTGATIRTNMSNPGVRAVAQALMLEAIAVAASHGFDVAADVAAMTDPQTRPNHKPSMLQDFEAGRRMEVDPILSCVSDFAKAAGVSTPTLDVIMPLVRAKARTAGLYGDAA